MILKHCRRNTHLIKCMLALRNIYNTVRKQSSKGHNSNTYDNFERKIKYVLYISDLSWIHVENLKMMS